MKKSYLVLFSDLLFLCACTFFISFTVIRYFLKNSLNALIFSAIVTAAVGVILFIFLNAGRKKKLATFLCESEKKSLALHLSVCSDGCVKDLFLNAIDGAYAVGDGVETDEAALFFNFKLQPLSGDDIVRVIKADGKKAKRVYCCYASPEALSFAEDFAIEILAIGDVYLLLKEKNLLPEKYALGKVKERGFFKRVRARFSRKLCPSLFFCGFFLLAFSFFTFYPVYYIASGAALMALSAVSLFIGERA